MTASVTCATDGVSRRRAITDTYDYDAFGNLLNSTGTTPNNYLYRGEQWDSDLGVYYLRARYYNPLNGRFMSRDPEDGKPVDPKALHKYLYASGDPVNNIDPTGRDSMLETGAIDFDFVLERLPKVVGLTCAAVEVLGWDISLANWIDSKLTGKPKDDFWPEIPTPVELACAIPGFIAGQKEIAKMLAEQ